MFAVKREELVSSQWHTQRSFNRTYRHVISLVKPLHLEEQRLKIIDMLRWFVGHVHRALSRKIFQ